MVTNVSKQRKKLTKSLSNQSLKPPVSIKKCRERKALRNISVLQKGNKGAVNLVYACKKNARQ